MKNTKRSGWWWVPSLYFAEGIPYIVVMTVSVIMYKRMGISNTDIALYTSWLYLPWVIKPLWSPLVDILKTKRWWIIIMQLFLGAGFAGVAFTIPVDNFFQYTLAFLWLLAFSSATHDIAADGFYMMGLSQHDQAWFVGVRSTFYRFAMITGQGLLIIFAGLIESNSGLENHYINIDVKPETHNAQIISPDSLLFETQEGELRILALQENIAVSTTKREKSRIDSLIDVANTWNLKNAFVIDEEARKIEEKKADHSLWGTYISKPLGNFLQKYFGQEKKVTENLSGNIAFIYLYLSKQPQKEVAVNFGRESGDKSINLINDTRFTFNRENWNKPAIAVIQLDPKLDYESSAVFLAQSGNIPLAWSVTFFIMAGMFILFFIYHKFILPYPKQDVLKSTSGVSELFKEFLNTFVLFFKKKNIGAILGFLLLYRFAEAQIVKLASPFLLDTQEAGGLALTTGEVGFVYGTVGLAALTIGGILGGIMASKHGLKFWLWPMAIAINLPDLVYVILAYTQTDSFFWINVGVAVEQFGYGFGFTAYMLFQIYVSEGEHKTAHFAITTAFMALGMMIPGMFSGWLQEIVGYQNFFIWVIIATIPAILVVKLAPVDPEFGKKK